MGLSIRLLQAQDLTTADQIFRIAFGTFIGLPDPIQFSGDARYFEHRWHMDPKAVFGAEWDGKLVGSNIAVNWGSFSFFGPLSVHPDFWNQGIAQRLIEAVLDRFEQWQTVQAGLFTFPNSPKHHALYQKFGFYPRFLTYIMTKSVQPIALQLQWSRYSDLNETDKLAALNASRRLTDALLEGLDVCQEIMAVETDQLGDTVLLWKESQLVGLAVCHIGAGTEAGSDSCYVKFAAVQPGHKASEHFDHLLDLCEHLTLATGMSQLLAGINTSHHDAYRQMLARHFRTAITGIALHRANQCAYYRPEVFALGDWR
ncbi:MAG: GNAT family N-acetyltransferase [Scytolyngbya sp. HA4215-MV1]|nr:GNAT family N-acetyltransferase [Scytolyngbya sp. HA4215-MV1]